MNGFANILLRAFGITPVHGGDIHTEEELKMIITESQEGGAIEETERELIQNVFEFDDRRVINVYTLKKMFPASMSTHRLKKLLIIVFQRGIHVIRYMAKQRKISWECFTPRVYSGNLPKTAKTFQSLPFCVNLFLFPKPH